MEDGSSIINPRKWWEQCTYKVASRLHIFSEALQDYHDGAEPSLTDRWVEISTQVPTSTDNKSLKHLRHVQGHCGIDCEAKDRQGPPVDAKDRSRF